MSRYEVIRPVRPSWVARVGAQLRSYTRGPYSLKSIEAALAGNGAPSSAGVAVTEQSALNYAPVWAAVSLISGDVGSLPLVLYKRLKGGGKERYEDHSLYRILHDTPNPEMTSVAFRRTLQAHALTWGNGFAEIERDGADRPKYLWPLAPDACQPFRDSQQRLMYRVRNPGGGDVVFQPRDILHVPGLGFDGTTGYSVIAKARESIALGIAAEKFGGTFFGNGASFGGVFSHPTKMEDKAVKNWQDSVNARHEGVERAHKFLLVQGGMKYDRLGIPPNDAQFLETRQFQITEIARWFNVPPHKIGDLSRATFSNIEQQAIEYYTTTLIHWLRAWEQELMFKLVSPLERNTQVIEHVVEGLLRGDAAGRADFYGKLYNIGAITPNEIRALENMNPLAGGDVSYVPFNMVPADRVNEVLDANIKAKTTPTPAPQPDPAAANRIAELEEELRKEIDHSGRRDAAQELRIANLQVELTTAIQRAAEAEAGLDVRNDLMTGLRAEVTQWQAEAERLRVEDERLQLELGRALADATGWETKASERADKIVTLTGERDNQADVIAGLSAGLESVRAELSHTIELLDGAKVALAAEQVERVLALAQADQSVADAVAARLTAEAERSSAERVAADATAAGLEAMAARARAEEARTQAEATLTAERDAEASRLTVLVTAQRALMVDAMGRLIRRETEKARRNQATPEKLRAWASSFYSLHEEACCEILQPAIQASLALRGSTDDPVDVTATLVAEHVEVSQRQLLAVADVDPDEFHGELNKLLTRWEAQRPTAVADQMQTKEFSSVRTYRKSA